MNLFQTVYSKNWIFKYYCVAIWFRFNFIEFVWLYSFSLDWSCGLFMLCRYIRLPLHMCTLVVFAFVFVWQLLFLIHRIVWINLGSIWMISAHQIFKNICWTNCNCHCIATFAFLKVTPSIVPFKNEFIHWLNISYFIHENIN